MKKNSFFLFVYSFIIIYFPFLCEEFDIIDIDTNLEYVSYKS